MAHVKLAVQQLLMNAPYLESLVTCGSVLAGQLTKRVCEALVKGSLSFLQKLLQQLP